MEYKAKYPPLFRCAGSCHGCPERNVCKKTFGPPGNVKHYAFSDFELSLPYRTLGIGASDYMWTDYRLGSGSPPHWDSYVQPAFIID